MKKAEIVEGRTYIAKVSGRIVPCRVDRIEKRTKTRYTRGGAFYHVTNLTTKKELVFRSASRFRRPA